MDYRIRFPAAKIDFAADVGLTSTDIDNYPAPGEQARYDWMRCALLGLLTAQASTSEPTIMADGTPWFDLNENVLKIRVGTDWVSYSEVVKLADDVTLASWYSEVADALTSLSQEVVFSGSSAANSVITITIPESLRAYVFSDSRCFLYVNGLLVDPRKCSFVGGSTPTAIALSGTSLSTGDEFTAYIRRVPTSSFYTPDVVVS